MTPKEFNLTAPKPKRQYPEQKLQRSVVEFLSAAMPQDSFWYAVPNGAWLKNAREAAKLKWLGMKPGVMDIAIVYRGWCYGLELKAKKRKPDDDQLRVHQELARAGADVCVCWTLDEVRAALIGWNIPLRNVGEWVSRKLNQREAA